MSKDQLFLAFQEAFSDYEIQLNQKELFRMLKRRGYRSGLSYGAFINDRLVSFTLNGIGTYHGHRTAYDTGTGTLPEYRGNGIAGAVFKHAEEQLKAAWIQQYLLEVLQHNAPAVKLYKKLGFEISRSFNYFHQDVRKVSAKTVNHELLEKVKPMPLSAFEDGIFGDFSASWQNHVTAVKRSPEDFVAFGFEEDGQKLGMLIFDPTTGDITQIMVHHEHRRRGIGTAMIHKSLEINSHPSIKLINSDSRDQGLTKFMESLNIPLQGKQYEMIKQF